MKKLGAQNVKEYYIKQLPAQVQLAEKMKSRGIRVEPGTRLEYIIIETLTDNDKQANKIEDIQYYKKHKHIINIDYLDYVRQLVKPIDDIFHIIFNNKDFMKKHFIQRKYKHQCNQQIIQLFSPFKIIQYTG